ncbi:MAG TPA: FtsX-like permease family protein [Steroidobacteraceae bacterium]
MSVLRQSLVVSQLSLSSLRQRFWSSLVVVIGMACVVGVLLSMLSTTTGMVRAFQNSGDPDRAIVVATLVHGDAKGGLTREKIGTLLNAPGIARDPSGHALADGEVDQQLPPSAGFAEGTLLLRGVGSAGIALRPNWRMVAGRMFRSGRHEVIAGIGAAQVFGVKVGDTITTRQGEWPVVGEFSDGGGVLESELVGDVESIMTTWKRPIYDSVVVRLASATDFDAFQKWLTTNPALAVTAVRESDWYLQMSNHRTPFFTAMAYLVGAIMALGALVGGMRIMYATVNSRTREIATLRAIGYEAIPVAISVVVECALLSVAGAMIGAFLAWLLFDGQHSSLGESIFDLYVSPGLIAVGLSWALLIAVLGGLLPAIRAARLSVAAAFRAE